VFNVKVQKHKASLQQSRQSINYLHKDWFKSEAVRIAAGLRLESKLCEPHECVCGSSVESRGHHGLSCRRSSGRSSRHHNLNDIVWRALAKAEVPAVKEPNGLSRSDGKRLDGLTQIPWVGGKSLLWDVTVTDTLANSYIDISSVSA